MHKKRLQHNLKVFGAILAGVLLLGGMMASLGAGPDEPKATSVNTQWEMFEGHAYADHRAAPEGMSLIACLGGCEDGFVTEPVTTGEDGLYQVKVEPGQFRPHGRMVTFWLVSDAERVEADQDVLFRGNGEVRVLDLNFQELPQAATVVPDNAQSVGITTDLTVPSANELGLVPTNSPSAYANGLSYGGIPLLPGFVLVLGLLLAAVGMSLLVYRRRMTW